MFICHVNKLILVIGVVNVTMDVPDSTLFCNHDWDPLYLRGIFDTEFNDFSDLWCSDINDMDLLSHVEQVEHYCPIVEDISLDDETLCKAVEGIERE